MRTAPAIALLAVALFGLTACQPEHTPIIPTPAPSTTPIFASDEEALAAAEEAYRAYLGVLDEIRHRGGSGIEALDSVSTPEVVAHESPGLKTMKTNGERTTGLTTFDSMSIQSTFPNAALGQVAVVVYVCEDFSDTDVLGSDDKSIIGPDRQTRWPLTLAFAVPDGGLSNLVVSDIQDWTGTNFCGE